MKQIGNFFAFNLQTITIQQQQKILLFYLVIYELNEK